MSYLNGPRINFWGGASSNVDTANNATNGVVDLLNARVASPLSDDAIIAQLRQPTTQGGQPYYTEAGWNYYGDHQVAFMGATVSSCGAPGAVSTTDPLVGQPVYLLGSLDPVTGKGPYGGAVMVDLDPTSSQSTQIYVGGLMIGTPDKPLLVLRYDAPCHSHLLGLRYPTSLPTPFATPGSAWANGTFQLGFPTSSIVSCDASMAALTALTQVPGAIGLVVRFSFFEFMPSMSTADLVADYAANYNDPNPSLGRVIGTIGAWLPGEPATCPAGRQLVNTGLGGAQGVAYLDTANSRLSLDLSSALPGQAIRSSSTANTAPIGPNVDFGNLQISAAGSSSSTTPLASTPSLPADYYLYGGIYDIPLSSAAVTALGANAIAIGSSQNGLNLVENATRIYADARNIYLDEVGGRIAITLTVSQLGGPVTSDTDIDLTVGASGTYPPGAFLAYPTSVTVLQGSSQVTFTVADNGAGAGFAQLDFALSGANPNNPPAYFINFRKYPVFDYSNVISAGNIPWSFVYEECLRYFYVLFPAMSKRIPLNDEATVTAVAGEFLKRLSDKYRPTTMYMPLTRSMPPTKVALLEAYLHQVSAPSGSTGGGAPVAGKSGPPPGVIGKS